MSTVDFNTIYKELAAQLGDISYKIRALEVMREETINAIKKLDNLAAKAKENEAKENQAKRNSSGSNSPV